MEISLPTKSIEFFKLNGELCFIQDSKVHPWDEITIDTLNILRRDLDRFPEKITALEEAGVDGVHQLYHFAMCCHGDLNNNPDFLNGRNNLADNEYSPCNIRGTGTCRFKEVLCNKGTFEAPFGTFSRREVEIAKIVTEGLTDEEIAEKLFVSKNTIKTHISHIGDKIGRNTKSSIAAFAAQHLL